MANKQQGFWYSVISYVASSSRNELLNVGLILNSEKDKDTFFDILPATNAKLKYFFTNSTEKENYKNTLSYMKKLLQMSKPNDLGLGLDTHPQKMLLQLHGEFGLPNGLFIDLPRYAEAYDKNKLFNQLFEIYLGEAHQKRNIRTVAIKQRASEYFDSKNLIGSKIKSNVLVSPSKKFPINLKIDFVFGIKDSINLLQSAPNSENKEVITDWYQKMTTFSSKYEKDSDILILNQNTLDNKKGIDSDNNEVIISQMIDDLTSDDERIKLVDMDSELSSLTDRIEEKGLNIEEINRLLTA